jgi:hypothetical protein
MARRLLAMTSVVALALLVAACGGDDGAAATTTVAGDAASVSAAIVSSLASADATGPFDAASAQCAATGFIDAIGLDRMAEMINTAGEAIVGDPASLFAQMSADESVLALGVSEGCLDLASAVPSTMLAFGFPSGISDCVGGALAADGFGGTIIAAFLTGSDPTAEAGFSASYVGALSGACTTATHQLLVDDLASYGVSTDSAGCVADTFVAADNFPEIVAVWMGTADESIDATAINDQMTQVFKTCLTADELALLGIETGTTTTAGSGTTTTAGSGTTTTSQP